MNIENILQVSGGGLEIQRLRLETIALNLANTFTTETEGVDLFQPLEVVVEGNSFSGEMSEMTLNAEVVERDVSPRLKFDPDHPHADLEGFVHMPNINPIDEMTNLTMATRAYEANVKVLNSAKTLALKAMEIGRG